MAEPSISIINRLLKRPLRIVHTSLRGPPEAMPVMEEGEAGMISTRELGVCKISTPLLDHFNCSPRV